MTAALQPLERDVHQQREQQENEPERERQPEVALTRVEGARRREGAGLTPDIAADRHGGSDLRDHVAEGGGDHGGEGEPGLARYGPRGAPAAGAQRLGRAPDPGVDALDRGGGECGGDGERETTSPTTIACQVYSHSTPPSGPRRDSRP